GPRGGAGMPSPPAPRRRSGPGRPSTPTTSSNWLSPPPAPSPAAPSPISWSGRPPCSGPSSPARRVSGPAPSGASRGPSTSGAARSPTPSPCATARPAAGIFFPQRPALRLTPHDYSPSVLRKIVRSAAREPSFREAAEAVAELAEVTPSGRQLDRIARELGERLRAERDEQVDRFRAGALEPRATTRPALAVVEVDGGRLQVRGAGEGPGAHEASWREDKIAIL